MAEPGAEKIEVATAGILDWCERKGLGRSFLVFLAASILFNFGMFIYVLLFNLYLLDIGYREDFLGLMSSLTTAGNVAGTFLSVMLNRRFGLHNKIILCFAGMPSGTRC